MVTNALLLAFHNAAFNATVSSLHNAVLGVIGVRRTFHSNGELRRKRCRPLPPLFNGHPRSRHGAGTPRRNGFITRPAIHVNRHTERAM